MWDRVGVWCELYMKDQRWGCERHKDGLAGRSGSPSGECWTGKSRVQRQEMRLSYIEYCTASAEAVKQYIA